MQVARNPLQKMPRFRKEAPSSIASSRPPIGAANAVDTPAATLDEQRTMVSQLIRSIFLVIRYISDIELSVYHRIESHFASDLVR